MNVGDDGFLVTLKELQGGATYAELNRKLKEVVGAVRAHGKPGSLTLTIKIAPNASGSQLFIDDKVDTKLPEQPRETTIMFADEENNTLTRRDPRQPMLPGAVIAHRRPMAVNEKTGEITE